MINYALIGCGRISINHMLASTENKNINIVALCDIKKEKAQALAKKYNLDSVKIYTNYKQMIENEDLTLVSIATESGKHAKIAIDVMNKGINVIVEKPMALSLCDADKMIETAKKNNVILYPCHQNRFNKSIQKLKHAIDNDMLGKILHITANIRWNRNQDYYKQSPWRGTWEQDGGALMNQCIHNIDLTCWLAGATPESLMAYTDNLMHPYIEAEDLGIGVVRFKNGVYAVIEGTTNVYPKNFEETLYIFGEKGTVKVGGKSVNKIEYWDLKDDKESSEEILKEYSEMPENIYGNGHIKLYCDVVDVILNKKVPTITPQEGKTAVEVVLGMYLSSIKKEMINFPQKEINTRDFIGIFN